MLGLKNNLLVDRRTYTFMGHWKNPQQDLESVVYYFVSQPMTLVNEWRNGREQLVPQLEITICGEFPIVCGDYITLQNNEVKRVEGISLNYFESNIAVRDMLKQRVESMVITLR